MSDRLVSLPNGEVDELELDGVNIGIESMGEISGHEVYQLHIWEPGNGRALVSFSMQNMVIADSVYPERLQRYLEARDQVVRDVV